MLTYFGLINTVYICNESPPYVTMVPL